MDEGKHLVLYDGVCGLCDRTVQFILKRDRNDMFRFAPLQGELAAGILRGHQLSAQPLATMYVVEKLGTPNEKIYERSQAAVVILAQLGGAWRWLARAVGVLPRPLRDFFYDLIARNRYRIFGRYESCRLPGEAEKSKFIE